ncbi:hypothetical protein [Streptomyces sp. NPDC101145]|uniref:hypothetical protein n=1 Tax=Streptomyces sp. NPDC101145 TaxID=3366112 RepID=UPI00381E2BFC
MSRLVHRLVAARNKLVEQQDLVWDLKAQLDVEIDRTNHLQAVLRSYDPDHVADLERQVQELTAEINDLRAGRPDAPLIAELRRRLRLSERARASLDQQIATLQAANEYAARESYDRQWPA